MKGVVPRTTGVHLVVCSIWRTTFLTAAGQGGHRLTATAVVHSRWRGGRE